jgi:DNA-binding transcriptional MerR regulator
LGEYAITPLYNIKAVVQTTGISPSTLRAWERRYNIARPQRSDSGYRLYSERDIAVIRWLKAQTDAGMSISQAVSWLGNLIDEAGDTEEAILPVAGGGVPLHDTLGALPPPPREEVRDLKTIRHELLLALSHFDEQGAESVIAEAFSLYSVEHIGDKLFLPVLQELGEWRKRSDLGATTERFASSYLIQRLGSLLRATPNQPGGTLLWVGSARTELHEASALLLCIYLRRSGYHVHYLGQNLPMEEDGIKDLVLEARRHRPAMILFSANTQHPTKSEGGEKLGQLASSLNHSNHLPAIIGYSGPLYTRNPDLRAATAGVYIGTFAKEVKQNIDQLLSDKHRTE